MAHALGRVGDLKSNVMDKWEDLKGTLAVNGVVNPVSDLSLEDLQLGNDVLNWISYGRENSPLPPMEQPQLQDRGSLLVKMQGELALEKIKDYADNPASVNQWLTELTAEQRVKIQRLAQYLLDVAEVFAKA